MDETRPILCGKCHVAFERGFERDGEARAKCPVCGKEGRGEDISRETAAYYTRQTAAYYIGNVTRSVFKSNSVTVKSPSQRKYRWITGGHMHGFIYFSNQ